MFKFTDTIKVNCISNIKEISIPVSLNYVYITNIGYTDFGYIWDVDYYVNKNILSLNVTLLSDYQNYKEIKGEFFIDGGVDDYFAYYLNGASFGTSKIKTCTGGPSCLYNTREQNKKSFNVTTNNIKTSINIISHGGDYGAIVWSAYIKITTYSK